MNREKHFIVDILFVLALFGVFTVSALMLVTIGAKVYQQTVNDMSSNYETRTSVAYVSEKLRQHDAVLASDSGAENTVRLSDLSGCPALLLKQETAGRIYFTYLYFYEGHLKELLIDSGTQLGNSAPAAGQNIMELSGFSIEQPKDNLFCVTLVLPDDDSYRFYISSHCPAQSTH